MASKIMFAHIVYIAVTPSGISSSIFTKTENRAIKNGELGHHFKTSKGYFGASLEYYVRLLCSVSA